MNKDFYKLLNKKDFDLDDSDEIIKLIKNGTKGVLGIGRGKPIGLFATTGQDRDTVFMLLAKQDKLSDIVTVLFDDVVSIVQRETGNLMDLEDDKDGAAYLVVKFCLKNNTKSNNALSYSIEKEKYDVLNKIVKFSTKREKFDINIFQKYLEKINTKDLVKIVLTSIDNDYKDLNNFFFKSLQDSEQRHKVPELIESVKQKNYLDKGIKNQLTQLCYHSYNDIIYNVSIKEEEKQKLVTLIDGSLKYEEQFKKQFFDIDVSLREYVLDFLCKQYLNNVEDFQIADIEPLFDMLDKNHNINFNALSIIETQREDSILMNNSKINTTEINASSSNDSYTSLILNILFSAAALFVVSSFVRKYFQKIGDSDTADASQNRLVETLSFDSNNLDKFLKKLVLKEEYSVEERKILYYRAQKLSKEIGYTKEKKEKCNLIFLKAYQNQKDLLDICKDHKVIIKTIAQKMGISVGSDSVFSENLSSPCSDALTSVVSENLSSLCGDVLTILKEGTEILVAGENDLYE